VRRSLWLIALLLFIAVVAPLLAPHDPFALHPPHVLQSPSFSFPFGTDYLGRCVLSRTLQGWRISLLLAGSVVMISLFVGVCFGSLAAQFGGWPGELLMRVTDGLFSLPQLVLALVIGGLREPGVLNLILVLSVTGWLRYARLSYTLTLATRASLFVEAARSLGASDAHLWRRHLLPELIPAAFTLATASLRQVILMAASLNYLGLGLPPPTAEWGAMLYAARPYFRTAPHLVIFPGLALFLTVALLQLCRSHREQS
jgi:peptide/nickel transport system permease protein